MILRTVAVIGVVAILAIPTTGFGQGLIGKWWYNLDGVPIYFTFTDCDVPEIDFLGRSGKAHYWVKERGPPLKLEVCPTDEKTSECSSVHVYLLGSETLQWVPDVDQPLASEVQLTDMVMQREASDPSELRCKPRQKKQAEQE